MNVHSDTISIRLATPDDAAALARLALLDSSPLPAEPLLLAERGGRLEAALGLRDGAAVADPFSPSAELVALLRVRAERLQPHGIPAGRLRGAISHLRGSRAYAS